MGAEEPATQDQATTTRLPGPSQLRREATERAIAFTYQNCCSESIHSSSEQAQQTAEAGRPEAAEILGSLAMSQSEPSTTIHDLQESALHCLCASRSPWDPSCGMARTSSTTS